MKSSWVESPTPAYFSVSPLRFHVRICPHWRTHASRTVLYVLEHVKLRNPHNFDVSTKFRWPEAHTVCGFSHPSSESRRGNGLSAYFRVWHENVNNYFLQWSFIQFSNDMNNVIKFRISHLLFCLCSSKEQLNQDLLFRDLLAQKWVYIKGDQYLASLFWPRHFCTSKLKCYP